MSSEKTGQDEKIAELRRSIDGIDEAMLDLLNRRVALAAEIGRRKAKTGNRIMDKAREENVLQRLAALNRGPLSAVMLKRVFADIIAASRHAQEPRRVSYLGPEATFTHVAALGFFNEQDTFIPQPSIRDVFDDVEKGASAYGVVPVENSIEGAVNHTLDLFLESELRICAESYLVISHDLLSISGDLEKVRTIYSHPQPFAQCRVWLKTHLPHAELVECGSTSQAAQKALLADDAAAIAGSAAARLYDLKVVASGIQDVVRNTTRFLVIGRDTPRPTGSDKTSILFVTAHIPGALFKALEPIAAAGINMLKLESRPARHKNWSYVFFVDLEGHASDEKVKQCLAEMSAFCQFVKILGAYPVARSEAG
ncbi:MAG: prephenate dehydratase [Thermodesulfobacteriota bacterium]